MKRDEPWASVADVQRELGIARTKATELMRIHLGGFKPAGLDSWRCTWRAIREYKRKNEQGIPCHSDYPSSPEKPKAGDTGTATSGPRMIAESSERSTSETTEAKSPSARQQPPTGASSRAQQLVSLINADARARSFQRSQRLPKRKTSPNAKIPPT